MARDWYSLLGLLAAVAVSGCSDDAGANADPVVPASGVRAPAAIATATTAGATRGADSTPAADSVRHVREIEIMRETFAYQGGVRDPFSSLVRGISTGPELADLELVVVLEDRQRPSKSVVVLREKMGGKRHRMKAGDRLGRIRLVQIQPKTAVFTIQDFGFERQETLSLRKQEDVTP